MYVVRGAVDSMPYYAGRTIKDTTTVYSWSSTKYKARQYKCWLVAAAVASKLLYDGTTSHVSIERV